jgi:poly(3-hydroxyalkanoate) synthetase
MQIKDRARMSEVIDLDEGKPPRHNANAIRDTVAAAHSRFSSNPLIWPLIAAATATDAAAAYLNDVALAFIGEDSGRKELPQPRWATPNRCVLDLKTVRLRDFSTAADGVATLICAPFALHGATVADFAPGHSLVGALRKAGLGRVLVTDWRSASPDMRSLSIDDYLADLNVVVDQIGPPVDLVGLCQGGWMALVYAARFPAKVRRLVLAGAPVDTHAADSRLSALVKDLPVGAFAEIVRLGDGLVIGSRMLKLWGPVLAAEDIGRTLQIGPDVAASRRAELERRFRIWYDWTVDLPGTYYLQIISWLFKENRIAKGRFVALGRAIDLSRLDHPIFLLAGRDDDLVSVPQLLATARLVGTPPDRIAIAVEPCGHLSLFLGAETLAGAWSKVARWLRADPTEDMSGG